MSPSTSFIAFSALFLVLASVIFGVRWYAEDSYRCAQTRSFVLEGCSGSVGGNVPGANDEYGNGKEGRQISLASSSRRCSQILSSVNNRKDYTFWSVA